MCVSGRPMNPGAGRKDSYLDLENSKFRCQCLSRGFLHGEGEGSVHHIVLIDVCEAFSALEREPLYNGGVCVKITFVSSKQEKNVIDRSKLGDGSRSYNNLRRTRAVLPWRWRFVSHEPFVKVHVATATLPLSKQRR